MKGIALAALLISTPAVAAEPAAAAPPAEAKARAWFTDTPLTTQTGEQVRFFSDVLANRTVVVNFVFTRCEGACPIMTSRLNQLRARLGERFGRDVFFVSISIDPRDTPEALRAFAEKNRATHPGWLFLTGTKENVASVVKRLGQYVDAPEDHSTLLLAGNSRTNHWKKLRSDLPTPALVESLHLLAGDP